MAVTVEGFADTAVDGRGGDNTADLYGSPGDDRFGNSGDRVRDFDLNAAGASLKLLAFSDVSFHGNGGLDKAWLHGDAASASVENLRAAPGRTELSGSDPAGAAWIVRGLDVSDVQVFAYGQPATLADQAVLFGSSGDDRLVSNAAEGRQSLSAGGSVLRVEGFESVDAYLAQGTDYAELVGGDAGDTVAADSLEVWPALRARLDSIGPARSTVAVEGVDQFLAVAQGLGIDRAVLHDSRGDDVLSLSSTATGLPTTLVRRAGDTTPHTEVRGFSSVSCVADSGGFDRAFTDPALGGFTFAGFEYLEQSAAVGIEPQAAFDRVADVVCRGGRRRPSSRGWFAGRDRLACLHAPPGHGGVRPGNAAGHAFHRPGLHR